MAESYITGSSQDSDWLHSPEEPSQKARVPSVIAPHIHLQVNNEKDTRANISHHPVGSIEWCQGWGDANFVRAAPPPATFPVQKRMYHATHQDITKRKDYLPIMSPWFRLSWPVWVRGTCSQLAGKSSACTPEVEDFTWQTMSGLTLLIAAAMLRKKQ
jgi:hypothetical protein